MGKKIESVSSLVVKEGKESLNIDNSEAFERLDLHIRSLEALARETFQLQFRQEYRSVVGKLENGEALNDSDKELLSQLIIAEAKGYVKYEKAYENWKDDVARLLSDLQVIQQRGGTSSEDLLHIQAICRDLRAVLPDLTFYLRERERVQSYEKNDLEALSPELKKLLAEIVTAMMTSSKM